MIRKLIPIIRFCTENKMPENQYLTLACKKMAELTSLIEQNLDEDRADYSSTDKIIKVTSPSISIVINTQTPNRQLWYSSTVSGPQRFDYDSPNQKWINSSGQYIDEVFEKDLKLVE